MILAVCSVGLHAYNMLASVLPVLQAFHVQGVNVSLGVGGFNKVSAGGTDWEFPCLGRPRVERQRVSGAILSPVVIHPLGARVGLRFQLDP